MKTQFLLTTAIFVSILAAAKPLPEKTGKLDLSSVTGKPNPIFNYVRGHRQGPGVTMMWASSASNATVRSFTVIRTYEDPMDPYAEWTPVATAICNSSRSYRSTDNSVSPGFVSYRIVAELVAGGYVYSDIETIHIVQR